MLTNLAKSTPPPPIVESFIHIQLGGRGGSQHYRELPLKTIGRIYIWVVLYIIYFLWYY
jgi:hypothetical protein